MSPLYLHFRLFGTLELASRDDPPQRNPGQEQGKTGGDPSPIAPGSPTAQSLLAYLVLQKGRAVSRDRLTGVFWPDRSAQRARRALSHTLWQIRQALGPAHDRLVTEGDAVAFALQDGDWLDVEAFEESLSRSMSTEVSEALPPRPPAASSAELREAVDLYRADFLEGIYDDWALVERERLRELYLYAVERLIALYKRRGDHARALACAQRLAAADPLREAAHRELMRLYHLLGRPRAALEQFGTLRDLLTEELNAEPSSATVALHHEISLALGEAEPAHLPLRSSAPPLLRDLAHLPLVGRIRERAALIDALQAALQGNGTIALMEGDAGVGKTRLVSELVADAKWRGFQVGLGKADPMDASAPYKLLSSVLAPLLTPLRVAQLLELVAPQALNASSALFPTLVESLPERPPLAPLDSLENEERLRDGLARCVAGLAVVAPVLLVLEDVHWADAPTLAASLHLARGLPGSRVLLVLTYRTFEAREREAVWETLQSLDGLLPLSRLTLRSFGRTDTADLVRRALDLTVEDARPADFIQRLQSETGGNPLFLVETLKSLLEDTSLTLSSSGDWVFPSGDAALPTSASIRDLIGSRLARLSPSLRSVMEQIAVLGDDTEFSTLAEASELDPGTLVGRLEALRQRGFVVEAEAEAAYRVEHDRVQEVVYQTVAPDRRLWLHHHAGAALEVEHSERVESLARHFRLGEVWNKAADYGRRAGDRARAVYAGPEAITYYTEALEACKRMRPPDALLSLDIHQARGEVCQETGRFDQAEADFRAAQGLAADTGDYHRQTRVLNHLSYLTFQRGDFEKAAGIARQALDLSVGIEYEPEIAAALFNLANALRNMGVYEEAIERYERAAAAFEQLDDQRRLADCLNRMGAAINRIGGFGRAHDLISRSLTIRRRLGDKVGISYSLINLAMSRGYMGAFDGMREAAQEALAVSTEIGDPYGQDAALHGLGVATSEQGQPAEALTFFRRALLIAREIGDQALEPVTMVEMGRAHQQMGNLDTAGELLKEALSRASISVEQSHVPELHTFLALFFLATGCADCALNHARTALDEARAEGGPWALGFAHRVMGQVVEHLGPEAIESDPVVYFEKAIRIQREIGAQAELARSLAAYGLYVRCLKGSDVTLRSRALLEEATTLYRTLGMAADLDRLEAESGRGCSPAVVQVSLPRAAAPTGRPLREDEYASVTWTVGAPEDTSVSGKLNRRRHRIIRLLHEAAEQSAAPTVTDLADVLDVTPRTIKRDLAALRAQGHDVRTRGSRAK